MDKPENKVAEFFDVDSSDYLEDKYVKNGDSFMALRRNKAKEVLMKYVAPSFNERFQFLDCGCGPGILLNVLARHGINYSGVDISEGMLTLAKTQPDDGPSVLVKKHLIRGDVERLPFRPGSFDAAASLGVIEYLEEDDRLLAEMTRAVKPDGYLLIAVTNRYSYNLLLEEPLNFLRKNRLAVKILNSIKVSLRLGAFRQAEFRKRRHSPREFTKRLGRHNLRIIDTVSWGFNFLPHPLHHLCGNALNKRANSFYDKIKNRRLKLIGEGYMVLCQRKQPEGSIA